MKTLAEHQADNPDYEVWQAFRDSWEGGWDNVDVLLCDTWTPIEKHLGVTGAWAGSHFTNAQVFAYAGAIFRRPKPRPKSLVLERKETTYQDIACFKCSNGAYWGDALIDFAKPGEKLLVTRMEEGE